MTINLPGAGPGMNRFLRNIEQKHELPAVMNSPIAALAYAAAQNGYSHARTWWRTHRTWTVTINGDDELFYDAQFWLMEQGGERSRKALTAKVYYTPNPTGPNRPELRFLADDNHPQDMDVNGHIVQVYVDDEGTGMNPNAGQMGVSLVKPPKLVFSAKTQVARDAVLELLRELRAERLKEKRPPGLMVLDKWGDWRRRADLPARPMESVITKGDVVETLRRDMEDFVRRENDYVRRAIPYHRAYLLIGLPGTGKSSAVKAVANALGLDLWYAQLSGIDKDAKLADVFGEVRPRNVLLLEDIDSLPAAIDRTAENAPEGDISTSGLLNALDGVATPHGLITIMTTNHPDQLDSALMRPGRIDRILHFEYPDLETMHRHYRFFYGRPAAATDEWKLGRSSAAVSEIFKRHMDDPVAAEVALVQPPTAEETERDWHSAGPASFRGRRPEFARALEAEFLLDT